MSQIGIITEQGDLGYGFDTLNRSDKKIYNEAVKSEEIKKSYDNDGSKYNDQYNNK